MKPPAVVVDPTSQCMPTGPRLCTLQTWIASFMVACGSRTGTLAPPCVPQAALRCSLVSALHFVLFALSDHTLTTHTVHTQKLQGAWDCVQA